MRSNAGMATRWMGPALLAGLRPQLRLWLGLARLRLDLSRPSACLYQVSDSISPI